MNRQERALLKMDEILSLVRKRMKNDTGYDEHLLYSLATQLVLADERIEDLEEQNNKLWDSIHNFNGVFEGDDWASGPALVPDDQTVDPSTGAKKPKDALSAMAVIYSNLAKAIISNPDYAITNSTATMSGSNPKRLDIIAKFLLSGNATVRKGET